MAFPHTNTCISLLKGVKVERDNLTLNIKGRKESVDTISVEITGKYTQAFFVNYDGAFQEIAIIFKPLGVNHFLQHNLIEYASQFSQSLRIPEWHTLAHDLFLKQDITSRIQRLESFLLDTFLGKDLETMKKAVIHLEDFNSYYTIQHVADLCHLSLKSLQRNFHKHLTCTPLEYKRIAKFRHSIHEKILGQEITKLTQVAHNSTYYDQSYFIREYKKLTGINPKAFFNRISELTKDKIIWEVR